MIVEEGHDSGAFGGFSDALERFVFAQPAELRKAVVLALVVEQIAAKNFGQLFLRNKRRERQEYKSAFWTVATPVTSTSGGGLLERGIAAAKGSEIRAIFRESSGDFDFRQRPQQRKVIYAG